MIETEQEIGAKAKRDLPAGWRWVRLSEVGRFESGGTPPKDDLRFWGGMIPFVTGADITTFYVNGMYARAYLTDEGLLSGKTAVCEPGTVLFVTRTRVGRVGIAAEKMGASQDLSPYVCDTRLLPEYVCWYLLSISDYLIANCRGSTITGLTRNFVETLEIPLPPLAEQRRIASILHEQMGAVERARAAAEEQLEAAKALPAAYLREVFECDEAREWPVVRLSERADIGAGITLGRKLGPVPVRSVPYLRVANVKDGYLDLMDVYTTNATEAEIAKCRLRWGDLLLTEGGDPDKLGRGTFWEDQIPECIHQNHIFRVRFDLEHFSPRFLAAQLSSSYGKTYFLHHAKQTTGIATINQQVLGNFPLMCPSLSDQQRIAAQLDERMAQAARLRMTIQGQLDAIHALPEALLRRAFKGEL